MPQAKAQPQSREDELTEAALAFLKGVGKLALYSLFLTVGYDLFAPLVHTPIANPLQALGLLLALDVLKTKLLK